MTLRLAHYSVFLTGYKFAGLQLTACYCDSSFGSYGKAASEECDARCPGEPDDICGADLRNSVVEAGKFVTM